MDNKKNILIFLQKNKLGTLATVTKENQPDLATIYYIIDENFDLFFLTETQTQKYKNIQYQNDIAMVVTDPTKKITAKIQGKATLVDDKNTLPSVMNRVAQMLNDGESFDTILPILKRKEGQLFVIKIKPSKIRFSDYGSKELQEETVVF